MHIYYIIYRHLFCDCKHVHRVIYSPETTLPRVSVNIYVCVCVYRTYMCVCIYIAENKIMK